MRIDPSKHIDDWRADLAHFTSAPVAESAVCNTGSTPPTTYKHVIWILEENKSISQVIGNKNAPFISSLANQCAYTTNYTDDEPRLPKVKGYHSLSHYIAGVSGSNCVDGNDHQGTGCLTNDALGPAKQSLPTMTIFQQLQMTKLTWKSYQESSPGNCSLTGKGLYAPRHDAVLYFSAIRAECKKSDIAIPDLTEVDDTPTGPLIRAIQDNTLPTFSYVTPNLDHDMHNGSVELGDAWLRAYLDPLFKSPEYKNGSTAVFVIWDEANRTGQTLPNLMISPSAHGGITGVPVNGFAVLGATESMLGLSRLGCAADTPPGGVGSCYAGANTNLRAVFGL